MFCITSLESTPVTVTLFLMFLEYKVKERGQMHIEHLRELAREIAGLRHRDPDVMKYFDHEIIKLYNSLLRDCCIEIATTKEEVESATQTENYASVLVINKRLPEGVANKIKRMISSHDESITRSFLFILPELVQSIKEIFREEKISQTQSGLRGVTEETTLTKIASGIQDAAQNKSIFRLLSEVCHILENLCQNNNENRTTEARIQNWGSCAMIAVMLYFLEKFFQSTEARRLYKRLEVFSVSIRDIMSNPTAFEGSFLRDFHNVAISLLKFAKFDPSQLVRFELKDPTNSISTQGKDDIKYDQSKEIFSQLFLMIKEYEDELQLEAVAHVHMGGHLRTIGAFETVILLPASCNEAIDKAPIASLSVAVKREYNDSGNLRVTLYAMHKDNITKALEYLKKELGGDLAFSKQPEITKSSLKLFSLAKAGTVVKLRLIHKWGSETICVDSNSTSFVPLADSTAGSPSVSHLEPSG